MMARERDFTCILGYLAGTPDGVVGDTCLVEVSAIFNQLQSLNSFKYQVFFFFNETASGEMSDEVP